MRKWLVVDEEMVALRNDDIWDFDHCLMDKNPLYVNACSKTRSIYMEILKIIGEGWLQKDILKLKRETQW